MKIILDYDEVTGTLTDIQGSTVVYLGLKGFGEEDIKADVEDIIELVKLGVAPEDVIKMKNNGVI